MHFIWDGQPYKEWAVTKQGTAELALRPVSLKFRRLPSSTMRNLKLRSGAIPRLHVLCHGVRLSVGVQGDDARLRGSGSCSSRALAISRGWSRVFQWQP